MNVDVLTQDDLAQLKKDLLQEIREILKLDPTPKTKLWLKSAEVQKLLSCSPGTLQTLRINRTLTPTKIGGTWYYSTQQVNDLLNNTNQI